MISKLTEQLLFLPITLLKYVCTFVHYNKQTDRMVRSHGVPVINFWLAQLGSATARIVLTGVLIESVWAGHASDINEIVVTSFLLPLFLLSATFSINYLIQYNFSVYVTNQMMDTHKRLGRYFNLSRATRDGNENVIIGTYVASIMVNFMSVPSTAIFVQTFKGVFHHVRFDTFEHNMIIGMVGSCGLATDLFNMTHWGLFVFINLKSTAQFLELMVWKPGVTNTELSTYILMYRRFQICYKIMQDWSGQLLTIVHVCIGVMAVSYAFNTIYLFKMEDGSITLSIHMAVSFLFFAVGFDGLSNAIVKYTEASEEFLQSYQNMRDMSPDNKRMMRTLKPLHFEIRGLFTYDRVTFATIMQDFVLANAVDLLLTIEGV